MEIVSLEMLLDSDLGSFEIELDMQLLKMLLRIPWPLAECERYFVNMTWLEIVFSNRIILSHFFQHHCS